MQPGSTQRARSPRRGLHRDVVDRLGRRIVFGDMQPGTALLNEADLSLSLDVSRTVVREAIKVLAAKGLVESRPRTGTRVLPRTHWRLIDADVLGWHFESANPRLHAEVAEVRALIEPPAAGLAASRRTDEEAAQMEALFARLAASADDEQAYVAVDLELHALILLATHNELLAEMASTLGVALRVARTISIRAPGGAAASLEPHRRLVEAIVARDTERALIAMSAVVRSAAHDVRSVLALDGGGRRDAAVED